jgi:hypothetical protein
MRRREFIGGLARERELAELPGQACCPVIEAQDTKRFSLRIAVTTRAAHMRRGLTAPVVLRAP